MEEVKDLLGNRKNIWMRRREDGGKNRTVEKPRARMTKRGRRESWSGHFESWD